MAGKPPHIAKHNTFEEKKAASEIFWPSLSIFGVGAMMQLEIPGLPEPIGPPSKSCATCQEQQPLTEFYRDRSRRDGLTRECRKCDTARHRQHWRQNRERMRAKARQRYEANLTENRQRGAERRRSERGKAINRLAVKRYAERNAEKRQAHAAVSKAIREGILERPERCELAHLGGCSGRIEFHHDDYDRPLDVRALCTEHHSALHHKPCHYESPAPLFELCNVRPTSSAP